VKTVISERFQTYVAHQAQVELGFVPSLIRIANSINFNLFDILNSTVIRGKDNVLFEKGYIQSYQGQDYLGAEEIKKRIEEFNAWLVLHNLQKKVIVVLAPNKAELMRDFLPEAITPGNRNHPEIKAALEPTGITVLDTREWFLELPFDQSTTAYGTHWSMYGAALVADSLVKVMNSLSQNTSYKTETTKLESSTKPRYTDNDLEKLLNLMYPLPQQKYHYATLEFETEKKPLVLGIGDSYYWSFYDLDMVSQFFDPHSEYWYYGHELYDINKAKQPVNQGHLIQSPHKADFIIIVATEPNLIRFPFGLGQKE
jgi:ribosomal protein S8